MGSISKYAIFRAFSIPKILSGLFGFDEFERKFMGYSGQITGGQ